MTQVKFSNRPSRSFNNFVDGFFATVPSLLREDFVPARHQVPVNIRELENAYLLEVIAPGMDKEDFHISIEKNLLTIEGRLEKQEEVKQEKILRKEFRLQSFKRSFTIDENIDAENIAASYQNGVLTLNLPRKGEVKPSAKQIIIQ